MREASHQFKLNFLYERLYMQYALVLSLFIFGTLNATLH